MSHYSCYKNKDRKLWGCYHNCVIVNAMESIWDIVTTKITCDKAVEVKVILKTTRRTTSKPNTEVAVHMNLHRVTFLIIKPNSSSSTGITPHYGF